MRIIVTGCTGFIGQSLMPMLQKQCGQIEILTLNRDVEKAQRMYSSETYPCVKHIYAKDWERIQLFDPEMVIHLAAINASSTDSEMIEPLISTNITYGVLLLDALSRCKSLKLFINTGSFSEYRWGVSHFNSSYLYSATKTAFRPFLDYYSDLYGFKYITAIPYTVYGGKPTVKRLMDYIIESVGSMKPVNMTGGEQMLDFIHVDDVASFFVHVIRHIDKYQQLQNGEEFHLGTGRCITVRELASIVEKVTGRHCNINWGGLSYRERDTMYAAAPIAKNLALTDWYAGINIEQGVSNYIKTNFSYE